MAKALIPSHQLRFDFPDFETRNLPNWGLWTLNTKRKGEPMKQKSYRIDQFQQVLANIDPKVDTYISQCFFSKPNRRALNVAYMTHAYVDLDAYEIPEFKDLTLDQKSAHILAFCDESGIPEPTMIASSGRGLYCKWSFSSPIPRKPLMKFTRLNRALVDKFQPYEADEKCVDVSRILRVVGSTNTKENGGPVTVLHIANDNGRPKTYDFTEICNEVMKYSEADIQLFRKQKADQKALQKHIETVMSEGADAVFASSASQKRAMRFTWADWHWGILEDMTTLMALRGWDYVPEGMRDIWGHVGACQLAMVAQYMNLWVEIEEWSATVLPNDYRKKDLRAHSSTLMDRAKRAASGERVEFGGRSWSPIYTYRKETLIDLLQIESHEMKHLDCLIDKNEKYERNNSRRLESRRKTGLSREEFEAASSLKAQKALALRENGMTWKQVASEVGVVSVDAARTLVNRFKDAHSVK